MNWIYFSARRWGVLRPAAGRRAAGPPAGGLMREPAGGGESTLLGVERRAVHVARLTVGRAGEAQDDGLRDLLDPKLRGAQGAARES